MNAGAKGPRFRSRRRWTLGGLMLLIAGLAVPLAFHARQVRESERARVTAELTQILMLDLTKKFDLLIQSNVLQMRAQPAPAGEGVEILTPAPPPREESPR